MHFADECPGNTRRTLSLGPRVRPWQTRFPRGMSRRRTTLLGIAGLLIALRGR